MQMAAIKMNENFGALFSNGSACFKNEYGLSEMPKAKPLPYAKLKVLFLYFEMATQQKNINQI